MATKKSKRRATKKATKPAKTTKPKKAKKAKASKAKKASAARKARTRAPVAARRKPVKRARAVPKKPAKAKPTKRAAAPRAKPLRRRTASGHIDPRYAADLLSQTGHSKDDRPSFLPGPRSKDDLAEEFGEGFVETATTGEYESEDTNNQVVDEETGGPFVETTGDVEFARGTDPSNPIGAKREPFPKT